MSTNISSVNPFFKWDSSLHKICLFVTIFRFCFFKSKSHHWRNVLTKCPFSTFVSQKYVFFLSLSLSSPLLRVAAGSNIVRHLVVWQIVFDTNLAFVGLVVDTFDHVFYRQEVVRRVVGVKRGRGRADRGRRVRRSVQWGRDSSTTRNNGFKGRSVGEQIRTSFVVVRRKPMLPKSVTGCRHSSTDSLRQTISGHVGISGSQERTMLCSQCQHRIERSGGQRWSEESASRSVEEVVVEAEWEEVGWGGCGQSRGRRSEGDVGLVVVDVPVATRAAILSQLESWTEAVSVASNYWKGFKILIFSLSFCCQLLLISA